VPAFMDYIKRSKRGTGVAAEEQDSGGAPSAPTRVGVVPSSGTGSAPASIPQRRLLWRPEQPLPRGPDAVCVPKRFLEAAFDFQIDETACSDSTTRERRPTFTAKATV